MVRRRVAAFVWALAPLHVAQCYDLYPCTDKPSYTPLRCPAGTAVSCWSLDNDTTWVCWSQALVPPALFGPLPGTPGDANCKAWPTPPGSARGSYDGACTFLTPTAEPLLASPVTPLSWGEAHERAAATLGAMSEDEKYRLMRGVGWHWPDYGGWWDVRKFWYVGNTQGIPRLAIPSLNMQDSAGGFRAYWHELVGTVTCWPSQLALAATWNPDLVRVYAMALGEEFRGKGANVVLGPSVNVHRVARNGRNFEYLSGEDPYLGSRLAEAWVSGMQAQGVMAVVKHWVFNEQETHREAENSVVDKKTAWELYYPPFEAAVNTGVSAAMCSYNRVNGAHSCSSEQQLGVLKNDFGFRGFVQTDWWAAHQTSVAQGADQDMPGVADHGIGMTGTCSPPACKNTSIWFSPELLSRQNPHDISESVMRILAAIFRMNLTSSCTPPNCAAWFLRNVTSAGHVALARHIAAESVVLLKNERGILPLRGGQRGLRVLAVIGPAAVARPFDPNGQGQGSGAWNEGDYYSGGGSGHVAAGHVVTPLQGIQDRARLEGVQVIASTSNSTAEAVAAARQADVTVVVAAATGQEAVDRKDLHLQDNADAIIAAVAKYPRRIVVLMQLPGAVVMPWRDSVTSIMAMFLGGQATGSAWADVLFGDHAPSGRLPIMLPATEEDAIPPGQGRDVVYEEGLKTSYRNPAFTAAFPFGHGLTYTTFEYLPLSVVDCGFSGGELCIRAPVRNSGGRAARTVAQLYLKFPPVAGHPAPFLKGFRRTAVLLPGATEDVTFRLSGRDVSYYDEAVGGWLRAATATASVGESSEDIRQRLALVTGASEGGASLWAIAGTAVLLGLCAFSAMIYYSTRRRGGGLLGDPCNESDSDSSTSESNEDSHA